MRFSHLVERIGGERADAWEIHSEAMRRQREGQDIILLSVGDSDHDTPPAIVQAAVDSLWAGRTKYTGSRGDLRLREAIAARQGAHCGLDISPDQVVVTTGTQGALTAAILCTLDHGDELIVIEPMYVTYEAVAGLAGAKLVMVPAWPENGFLPDAKDIEAAVTDRTRAILYASPNNPTGSVLPGSLVKEIGEIAKRHDLWILADEVYAELIYEGKHVSPLQFPDLAERSVVTSSLSKSHAMSGWRMGWVISPEEMAPHMENVMLCTTYGLPGFNQDGAFHALTQDLPELAAIKESYRRRRDRLHQRLNAIEGLSCHLPTGAMFIMLDVRATGLSAQDYAFGLLRSQGVSLLPADTFGDSATGHVRLALGAPDDILEDAAGRIAAYTAEVMAGQCVPAE